MALLALAVPLGAAGGLTATVDKTRVTVGEPFAYTVTLTLPEGAQAKLPGEKAKFKGLEVRGYQPVETVGTPPQRQTVLRYTLVSFDVGKAAIKDFKVPVTQADGSRKEYLAPPVEVEVASVLPAEGQVEPKGYYDPVMLPGGWLNWLLWGLLGLLVLALLIWAWRRWRRKRQKAPQESPEVIRGPDETALAALQRLEEEGLVARGEMLAYYLRLGEVLRAWLQARLEFPVMGRTTRGVMYTLRARRTADAWRNDYLNLLKRADSVKFARVLPTDAEALADLELAGEVIKRAQTVAITQPVEPPPVPPARPQPPPRPASGGPPVPPPPPPPHLRGRPRS
jgi:hypothetical protein